jgi:hypothetical protein
MKLSGWVCVIATTAGIILNAPAYATENAIYPGMPSDTQTILCTHVDCTSSEMNAMALYRAKIADVGTHYFILGNLANSQLYAVQVDVARTNLGTPTGRLI